MLVYSCWYIYAINKIWDLLFCHYRGWSGLLLLLIPCNLQSLTLEDGESSLLIFYESKVTWQKRNEKSEKKEKEKQKEVKSERKRKAKRKKKKKRKKERKGYGKKVSLRGHLLKLIYWSLGSLAMWLIPCSDMLWQSLKFKYCIDAIAEEVKTK